MLDHPVTQRLEKTGSPYPVRNPQRPQEWLHEQKQPQKELSISEFMERRFGK